MAVVIRLATPEDLAAAEAIHVECLAGTNDAGADGSGWVATHRSEDPARDALLVAVDARVIAYVYGDDNYSADMAICRELAVTSIERGRKLARPLLGAFARYVVAAWSPNWIYLHPLPEQWLIDFYKGLGFVDVPDDSGYLRIAPAGLVELR
jgi:hypothetical protein